MNYIGKLYGKIGEKYIPLEMTSEQVDKLEQEKAYLLKVLKDIESIMRDSQTSFKWLEVYSLTKEALREIKQ